MKQGAFGSGARFDKDLAKSLEADAQALIDEGEKTLEENWENRMAMPCGVCRGSKLDPEDKSPCMACEGTGNDSVIVYGVEDGKLYGYAIQYGIDVFMEFCKAMREAEAEQPGGVFKDPVSGCEYINWFKLPTVIQMDLYAQGYDTNVLMVDENSHKELAKVIQQQYPKFMCTNRLSL